MRLKTNIFLWAFLASILPLIVLALSAITYSEKQYLKDVGREVNASLNNIVSEIDRRLYYERQMILSLANSAPMKQYLPVLRSMTRGDLHQGYFQLSDRLENFLSGFQGVVPGFRLIRVLDVEGNTLIKVHFGMGVVGSTDGIESTPYAEEQIDDPVFVRQLAELPPSVLSFILLPKSRWSVKDSRGPKMFDAIYPLVYKKETAGYLMVSFSGDLADKILDVVPRLHNGKLQVSELNPDIPARDGMVLYDDSLGLRFSRRDTSPMFLGAKKGNPLLDAARNKPHGEFQTDAGEFKTYYMEYLPYPNQLASWVLSARVSKHVLVEPFDQIRLAILWLVVVAVLISMVLANIGAKNISRPIIELGRNLKRYADGDHGSRVQIGGADEIRQMESSFNYMADTLEHATEERDRARGMMMQSAKLASIGEMAAGIGHEINNPLNNILTLTKLIKRNLPAGNESILKDIESLREEANRVTSIVRGILNFARQIPPQYTQFNALDWLEDTLSLVQQVSKSKHIECHLLVDPQSVIEGDRIQLQQVLVNLLLNACQASDGGSEIIVSMEKCGDRQLIHVEDHGRGIAEHDLDRIFDPFFSTKEVGEGSGLGLSISLGIVERHKGSIRIVNNSDGGVTATVELPMSANDVKKNGDNS